MEHLKNYLLIQQSGVWNFIEVIGALQRSMQDCPGLSDQIVIITDERESKKTVAITLHFVTIVCSADGSTFSSFTRGRPP